ncbi:MAG TPA: hypothetical protein PKI11_02375 [Candidatus Hydrogenedentes bacterium]|nr:hypothetical protein [Candidatus Hydrogenedentota bacterium]
MTTFASESDVRGRLQAHDTESVPTGLVTTALEDAHDALLRRLDPQYAEPPAAPGLVIGEALLAGAYLLRALASRDAIEQQRVTIGGQRIEAGDRFAALLAMADQSEKRAWRALEPFLLPMRPRVPLDVTASTPVLGQE